MAKRSAKKATRTSQPKATGKKTTSRTGSVRYAGVDIGGTKILALITDAKGKVLGRGRKKTKAEKNTFAGVMERVMATLTEACAEAKVKMEDLSAVGVGAPSPILPNGTAIAAPNMGWRRVPLVPALKKLTGRPVYAENDCNAGTLGEYALGAGQGAQTLVGMFVGTGLGGGIVHDGKLIVGVNHMAAEVGHMIVVEDGRACGCGHNGCLEAYASKTGMGRRFAWEIAHQGRASMLMDECGGEYANVRSGILSKCFKAGDQVVVETLMESAQYLGVGIGNLITLLGPDRVVIGGGVYEALGRQLLPAVKRAAKARVHPAASYRDTKIVLASLQDDAVALGAMVYARQHVEK